MTGTSELALEQAVIHVGARLDKIEASTEELIERLGRIEAILAQRCSAIDASLAGIVARLDRIDHRLGAVERLLWRDDEPPGLAY